jgi:hypothetical protein
MLLQPAIDARVGDVETVAFSVVSRTSDDNTCTIGYEGPMSKPGNVVQRASLHPQWTSEFGQCMYSQWCSKDWNPGDTVFTCIFHKSVYVIAQADSN